MLIVFLLGDFSGDTNQTAFILHTELIRTVIKRVISTKMFRGFISPRASAVILFEVTSCLTHFPSLPALWSSRAHLCVVIIYQYFSWDQRKPQPDHCQWLHETLHLLQDFIFHFVTPLWWITPPHLWPREMEPIQDLTPWLGVDEE